MEQNWCRIEQEKTTFLLLSRAKHRDPMCKRLTETTKLRNIAQHMKANIPGAKGEEKLGSTGTAQHCTKGRQEDAKVPDAKVCHELGSTGIAQESEPGGRQESLQLRCLSLSECGRATGRPSIIPGYVHRSSASNAHQHMTDCQIEAVICRAEKAQLLGSTGTAQKCKQGAFPKVPWAYRLRTT